MFTCDKTVTMEYNNSLLICFSIVIPTYNRPEILLETLSCLEKQNTDIAFEVIVVDDYSILPLPDLGFGKGERSNWKLLRNERNMGRAATRNRGIREAKGEYILMLDDDIWASPGLLQAHYEAQGTIGGGVVVGSMHIADEIARDIWNEFFCQWINDLHAAMEKQKDDLPYNYFFTGNVSLPGALFEKIGLFDESFTGYSGEDTELGYRLKKHKVRFVHEVKARGVHYNQETLDSLLKKREQMGAASFNLARRHPELSAELSIAGLLAPGTKYYQFLLSEPLLNGGKVLCRALATLQLKALCLGLLSGLCKAYSGLGLKKALHAE